MRGNEERQEGWEDYQTVPIRLIGGEGAADHEDDGDRDEADGRANSWRTKKARGQGSHNEGAADRVEHRVPSRVWRGGIPGEVERLHCFPELNAHDIQRVRRRRRSSLPERMAV